MYDFESVHIRKDNNIIKVHKPYRCLFCKEVLEQYTFRKHLNLKHNIFFGHEILLASKLLTFREKEHLIKRVQTKATNIENGENS